MDELEDLLRHPLRHVAWHGTFNVRDIGGYPTRGGRRTRWRTLLRGDGYYCLTEAACAEALRMGIRTIVDLRGDRERLERPSCFQTSYHMFYMNEPLFETDDPTYESDSASSRGDVYRAVVDRRSAELARIFVRLGQPDALPALVHCTAGKDRTGIVIALLLGLLGVHHRMIVADYALSTRFLTEDFIKDGLARAASRGVSREVWYRHFPCPPELMLSLLEHVDTTYGGVCEYLRAAGLTSTDIDALKNGLIE
jgi:protein-tyrosine phosphatase